MTACPCVIEALPADPTDAVMGNPVGGWLTIRYCPLHAAAPELLAALAGIVREWEAERLTWHENRPEVLSLRVPQPNNDHFDNARAAIAKATGGQP